MVSMFHFHDLVKTNFQFSKFGLLQTSVLLSLNISILSVFFAHMNLQISEAVKPKGDRDSVTFIFLAQWRATTFDPKIRQRIGWSWWWDKQRWLSDDQWTKKGGVGMLVRVTWRKMSTFFRNMVRNWSKLNNLPGTFSCTSYIFCSNISLWQTHKVYGLVSIALFLNDFKLLCLKGKISHISPFHSYSSKKGWKH